MAVQLLRAYAVAQDLRRGSADKLVEAMQAAVFGMIS
jgi:hypothetical protein